MLSKTPRPQTPADGAALEAAGWTMMHASAFGDLVGPVWTIADGERRRYGFFVADKHDNSQRRAHGGMIMTLCDDGMGHTAVSARPERKMFTVSFDCQFIGGAMPGDFVEAVCEVVRSTRSLMFMRATCVTGDRVIAAASGIWKILEDRPTKG